ncbi:Uncharacterised protein [Rothia aeria]|uniref:DUF4190 domain-containing protein n=1 Tax=Rothia aeria TaxID=172042 RepID=A0A7Z9A4Q7_9MICC|nr:hypothetical protein [Rothia aeria]VEI24604.1 Uncharacterised protein [Rothia aeria]
MSQSPYEQQPDNESNPRNSSSEQVYQNQQPAQPAYQQQPTYQQPMYAQPMMAVVPKTPQQIAGEQAAQTSMTLGVVGLVLILIFFGGPVSLILGIFAVKKAGEAERMGAMASGGRVMGWICIVVGCLETLAMLIPVAAFIITIIFAASSASSRSHLDLAYTLTPLMSLL